MSNITYSIVYLFSNYKLQFGLSTTIYQVRRPTEDSKQQSFTQVKIRTCESALLEVVRILLESLSELRELNGFGVSLRCLDNVILVHRLVDGSDRRLDSLSYELLGDLDGVMLQLLDLLGDGIGVGDVDVPILDQHLDLTRLHLGKVSLGEMVNDVLLRPKVSCLL